MIMPQLPDLRGIPYFNEPSSYMVMMDRLWAWEFFMQGAYPPIQITGSVDPADMRARFAHPSSDFRT